MLSTFLTAHRDAIVACALARAEGRARRRLGAKVRAGLSLTVDQLAHTLRADPTMAAPAIGTDVGWGAARHARELHRAGLRVAEVVHHYGDICQVVTELAGRMGTPISAGDFERFSAFLDEAIASGVTEHARQREIALAERRTERLEAVAHALHGKLAAGLLAFDTLKTGSVGVGGSTVAVLEQSLAGMRVIVDVSLEEVRSAAKAAPRARRRRSDEWITP